MDTDIGTRIRQLRIQQGLTLQDLGKKTKLSAGYISLVERGLASVSLTSLNYIAGALGVSNNELFRPLGTISKEVLRSYDLQVIRLLESQYICHSLKGNIPEDKRCMEPMLVTILPDQEQSSVLSQSRNGEEFGFVLEGVLTVTVEGKNYDLRIGDSLHIPSYIPHSWTNLTNKLVKILYVSLVVGFSQRRGNVAGINKN